MIDLEIAIMTLNKELENREVKVELVICGGALMILKGYSNRGTTDIDFLSPDMSHILIESKNTVAKELGYNPKWLNDHVKVFVDTFPKGWSGRLTEVREFSHLHILGISKQDLISNKLKSYMDRDFDRSDLIALKPTKLEFAIATKFVESFGLNEVELFDLKRAEEEIYDIE